MKRQAVFRVALLAFVPLVLLAVWLYLYTHSRAVDTSEQSRTLELLKDLKQLDAGWTADVLRSHADLNPNYDALVAPLASFSASVARLRARAARLHDPALDAAVAAVDTAVAAKAALIDRFKAQNSLYKNSLRYVPTAQRDIQARQPAVDAGLAFLVNETLRFCSVPDHEVGDALPPLIAEQRALLASAAPALREPVDNLLKHLETLLRLRSRQGELLRAISEVPVTARADALAAVFTRRFDAELAGQFRYQRLLLVYSAFALLLVISGTGFIGWRNATERRRLRSLVEAKTRELKDLATRDELTRVHNRRHMAELVQQQIALHARSGQPVCVALLDIDLFKSINDRHGHAAGDEVLRRFAAIATRTLRATDLLGRWGGEEFLVALPQTALEPAARTLHKLREALAKADFDDVADGLRISFSGGLVQLGAGEPIAAAVERADQAMYRAKTGGRNRIETVPAVGAALRAEPAKSDATLGAA